jgi:hypothetical protein
MKRRRNSWFSPQVTYHGKIVRTGSGGSSSSRSSSEDYEPKARPKPMESYMGARIYKVEDGYTTSIDRDSVHDTLGDAKRFIKSWKSNPRKNPKKFDRCVKDVSRSLKAAGRPGNAFAICKASQENGRIRMNIIPLDPYTATLLPGTLQEIEKQREKVAKRKPKAKRRRNRGSMKRRTLRRNPANPLPASQEAYEGFHGRPSTEEVSVSTPIEYHKYLAAIGDLRKFKILTPDGKYKVVVTFTKPYPILAMNEARTQLFIEGGDQSVDLKDFGISEPHEEEVLGTLRDVYYFTRKDHLGSEGGTAVYHHKFGSKEHHVFGKKRTPYPTVLYDTRNKLMRIAGGGYSIPDEGIDG